jgi:hypothetical protein
MGKQMEGNPEQRRQKAREARGQGMSASELSATGGASKQRHHVEKGAEHTDKVATVREGKQSMLAQKTPSPRPHSEGRGSNR